MRLKKRLNFCPRFLASLTLLTACTPTIQLDTPKDGITINMNVVVDHKISVEMDDKAQKTVGKTLEKQ
ncbi:MAG: YnbE family lipoprotein [Pasteurellaceae bacterium]|nr:YnbE family lipoprotein [Pasteurellaceae bacterium]